jgi:hypothetical protein
MLFVREHGTAGQFVITLHGGPGTPGGMLPVARRLADRYHVVEPCQRPSGDVPVTVAQHIQDLHELICLRAVDSPLCCLVHHGVRCWRSPTQQSTHAQLDQ